MEGRLSGSSLTHLDARVAYLLIVSSRNVFMLNSESTTFLNFLLSFKACRTCETKPPQQQIRGQGGSGQRIHSQKLLLLLHLSSQNVHHPQHVWVDAVCHHKAKLHLRHEILLSQVERSQIYSLSARQELQKHNSESINITLESQSPGLYVHQANDWTCQKPPVQDNAGWLVSLQTSINLQLCTEDRSSQTSPALSWRRMFCFQTAPAWPGQSLRPTYDW